MPPTDPLQSPPAQRQTAWRGLLRRKETWTLTLKGWILLLLLLVGCLLTLFLGVHPFLAITCRVQPDVLVIEGWMPEYALMDGWKEFQQGHYTTCLTSGGPFISRVDLDPGDDYADLAVRKLKKYLGNDIPIQAVPALGGKRDRTFASANAIKIWLRDHHRTPASITVVTLGPHARRSRLLYQKSFGSQTTIGIVSLENEEYERSRWWKYSEGVKEVLSESAAYVYARIFFHPTE